MMGHTSTPSLRSLYSGRMKRRIDRVRQEARRDRGTSLPSKEEAKEIIRLHAQKAASIAATFSLVPGPLGLLLLAKEMELIQRTHLAMICHLSPRMRDKDINVAALLSILGVAMGVIGVGASLRKGAPLLEAGINQGLLSHIHHKLARETAQRTTKHMLAKWLPLLGSLLIFGSTYLTTVAIGQRAYTNALSSSR